MKHQPIGEYTEAVLEKMREILAPEGHWIQKSFAKDAEGKMDNPLSDTAVCWCMSGALTKAVIEGGFGNTNAGNDVRSLLHRLTGDSSIAWWNDYVARSSHDVVKMLDLAIRECKKANP